MTLKRRSRSSSPTAALCTTLCAALIHAFGVIWSLQILGGLESLYQTAMRVFQL